MHGHRVRDAVGNHASERSAQGVHARRLGVGGIVGENVEDSPADDLVPLRHRGAQVGVADGDDREVGREDEEVLRRGLEQAPEVRSAGHHGRNSRPLG